MANGCGTFSFYARLHYSKPKITIWKEKSVFSLYIEHIYWNDIFLLFTSRPIDDNRAHYKIYDYYNKRTRTQTNAVAKII